MDSYINKLLFFSDYHYMTKNNQSQPAPRRFQLALITVPKMYNKQNFPLQNY